MGSSLTSLTKMQNNYKLDCLQVKLNLSEVGSFLFYPTNSHSKHSLIQPSSVPQLSEPGDDRVHGHVSGQLSHSPDEDEDHTHLDCQQVKF